MMSGEPGWVPPAGKTCHTGGTWGGVDFPPTWLLWFYEGAGEQSAPVGLSVRKLFPGISPQETSNGQLWQEIIPYTLYWACVTSLTLPSPPPPWGGGGAASLHPTPYWCWQWYGNNPAASPTPHSRQCTSCCIRSLYKIPFPVTCQV